MMEGHLLLVDKAGEKHSPQFAGLYTKTTKVNVLKGDLLVSVPGHEMIPRNDGGKPNNFRVKRDATISLYCDAQDVSPLENYEFLLLEAIPSPYDRFSLWIAGTALDWGHTLKNGADVFVTVPGYTAVATTATPRAAAKVRYVGGLGVDNDALPGIFFGVEIIEEKYRGQGTTDGTFRGIRFFDCKDNCGLVVSLDKLSPDREGSTLAKAPLGGKQLGRYPVGSQVSPAQADRSRPPNTQPPPNHQPPGKPKAQPRHKMKTRSKVETDIDAPNYPQFAIGDRVVVHNRNGIRIHGTVRWTGRETMTQDLGYFHVGVETDIQVRGSDFEGHKPGFAHMVSVENKRGRLFVPQGLVLHEEEAAEQAKVKSGSTDVGGVQISDAELAESREAHKEIEEERLKRDFEQALPPDVSLDMFAQKQELQQFEYDNEKQRAQRIPAIPREEMRQRHALAANQSNEPHLPRQDHVGGQQQFGVSGRGIRKAQSVPSENARQHNQYEEIDPAERCVSGGVAVAVQGDQPPHPKPRERLPRPQSDYPPATYPKHGGSSVPPGDPRHPQLAYQHPPQPRQPNPHSDEQGYDPSLPPRTAEGTTWSESRGQNGVTWVEGSHALQAFAQQPGGEPPMLHSQLSIGSTVQFGEPPRYGVIRWLGGLPGVQGLIAGIELDESIKGGCDGTWYRTGERYFHCAYEKGMFAPLHSLTPDERFVAPGSTPGAAVMKNPLEGVEFEVQEDVHIEGHPHQMMKYLGEERGIQGHQNSCYLDATVFGLFSLSDAFDEVFLKTPGDPEGQEICRMFWKGIVNPLRLNGVVRYESVMAMRNKLEELGKMKGVNHAEKDPEEFLNMLFKYTLDVEPFISIRRPFGVEKEFFVQLFVELSEHQLPRVGSLLIKMFKEQQISFTQVPSRLLIQVPRYGTKFKTYAKILPGLSLDVTEVTDSPVVTREEYCYICKKPAQFICTTCPEFQYEKELSCFCESCSKLVHGARAYERHELKPITNTSESEAPEANLSELQLLSVICIETSHYVCFTRSENQWIFFDSMANRVYDAYNIPKGVNCTKELNEWVYCRDHSRLLSTPPRELPEYVRRFVQDVYMCVYVQPDIGMYG